MSRRRNHASEEILMVPFLDILCSLIGVLVLIIVFLAVSQTTQTEGRTQEEVDRAILYKSLNQKKKDAEANEEMSKPLLTKLATLEEESEAKESAAARLRKLISEADASKVLSENLLKELDNLLLEITGYDQQTKDMKKEIETLAAETDLALGAAANPESYVRIVVTRGSGEIGLDPDDRLGRAAQVAALDHADETRDRDPRRARPGARGIKALEAAPGLGPRPRRVERGLGPVFLRPGSRVRGRRLLRHG